MMRLKVEKVGEGLHPSELVVTVRTKGGLEEVIIDPRSLWNGSLVVGWPVETQGGYRLVELPRQTSRGSSRVWVNKDDLVPEKRKATA